MKQLRWPHSLAALLGPLYSSCREVVAQLNLASTLLDDDDLFQVKRAASLSLEPTYCLIVAEDAALTEDTPPAS